MSVTYVPSADIGDWLDGITSTVISSIEVPPFNSKVTEMNPNASGPVKLVWANSTSSTTVRQHVVILVYKSEDCYLWCIEYRH